jgi:hypothetical protein
LQRPQRGFHGREGIDEIVQRCIFARDHLPPLFEGLSDLAGLRLPSGAQLRWRHGEELAPDLFAQRRVLRVHLLGEELLDKM